MVELEVVNRILGFWLPVLLLVAYVLGWLPSTNSDRQPIVLNIVILASIVGLFAINWHRLSDRFLLLPVAVGFVGLAYSVIVLLSSLRSAES